MTVRARHQVTVRQLTDVDTALVVECTCGQLDRIVDADDFERTAGVPIEELGRIAFDHCAGRRG